MSKIITTTTNNIEGCEVKQYYQPISSNVVVGTNLFSDISASFTDFFGGRSFSYEEKLNKLYSEAFDKLKNQAASLGANAVIGIAVDVDEISGGGKQMFMVSVTGTPVSIIKIGKNDTLSTNEGILDGKRISSIIAEKKLAEALEDADYQPTQQDLKTILNSNSGVLNTGIISFLSNHNIRRDSGLTEFIEYFKNLDANEAIEMIYDNLLDNPTNDFILNAKRIVSSFNLIDIQKNSDLLDSENDKVKILGLSLLNVDKDFYKAEDIDLITKAILKIESAFPIKFEYFTSKKGLFSSEEIERWKCSCGQTHSSIDRYCFSCKKSVYGLSDSEAQPDETIEHLKLTKATIEELL